MYKRLTNGLGDIGKLVPADVDINSCIQDPDTDYYLSVYLYNEKQKEKFYEPMKREKNGEEFESIHGAAGIFDVVTDKLIFDLDNSVLEDARRDTVKLIEVLKLHRVPENSIQLYFSGNKGFHIIINIDKLLTPEEHKKIAKELMSGIKSKDIKVYNASRILRMPGTKHPRSGLYKIPLALEEINLPIDEITELAKENYEVDETVFKTLSFPRTFQDILDKKEDNIINTDDIDTSVDIAWANKPSYLSNWKYALSQGFFPPGCRNHALMVLAATYKGLKKNKTETYYMLKAAADLQSQKTGQDKYSKAEIWDNIIKVVFNPNWQGGTYAEDSFPDELVEYFNEMEIPRFSSDQEKGLIENVDVGFDSFIEYAKNIEEYTMKFGIPSLDEKLKPRKGHLIYILAGPGVGKTSYAITLLNNMSKQGTNCYFGSYDMFRHNVYQKLIQRHTGLSEDDLYDIFVKNDEKRIKELKDILVKEYKNVTFCFKVGQSIRDLKESIIKEEERLGKSLDLIVVDYLELVLTDAKDPTAASAEAAQGLRELANEGRVVVGLLQPNKFSSTPDEPLLSYNAAKGSSSIAQSATAMITAHRPGLDSRDNNINDNYFSINCVKNRNGSLFSLDFGWDGKTQTLYELDDRQKADLKSLRERKKNDGLEEL